MTQRRWLIALAVLVAVTAASYALITYVRRQRTVADAVAIYGTAARARLRPSPTRSPHEPRRRHLHPRQERLHRLRGHRRSRHRGALHPRRRHRHRPDESHPRAERPPRRGAASRAGDAAVDPAIVAVDRRRTARVPDRDGVEQCDGRLRPLESVNEVLGRSDSRIHVSHGHMNALAARIK